MSAIAPSGAELVLVNQQFVYNALLVEPPASGNIRMNTAAQGTVTKVWLHYLTADGIDVKTILSSLAASPPAVLSLYIQRKDDASQWARWDVTGFADKVTYAEFTVVFHSGGVQLLAGSTVLVRAYDPPPATPATATRDAIAAQMLAGVINTAAIDSGRVTDRQEAITASVVLADQLIAALAGPPPIPSGNRIL